MTHSAFETAAVSFESSSIAKLGPKFEADNSILRCKSPAAGAGRSLNFLEFSFDLVSGLLRASKSSGYHLTVASQNSCQKTDDYSIIINFERFASIENFVATTLEMAASLLVGYY